MVDAASEERSGGNEALKVWGLTVAVVVAGVAVAYQFVGPPPPGELVLATGAEGGAYDAFGQRYRQRFVDFDLELRVLRTDGSVDNWAALREGRADVAFVQGGTAPPDAAEFAKGIASIYYEPLWVFHDASLEVSQLADLAGLRLEVGSPGSGTRAVADELLAANGIGAVEAELLGNEAVAAAEALLEGRADAVVLVAGPDSYAVRRLIEAEGDAVRLLDVDRALGYSRAFPYLSPVVLPEGVLDFRRNLPSRDVDLLAPTAALVAREDLHLALVPLFIEAAEELHGGGDPFAAPRSFPTPARLEVPLSRASEEYFENGRSFLYRVFPFAVAATLDRLKILLLPLLTLLVPLFRVAPPLYRWRIRRKIFRWYAHLDRIEGRYERDRSNREDCLERLAEVERDIIATVDVPASYMEELQNLRMHLERVRSRIAIEA